MALHAASVCTNELRAPPRTAAGGGRQRAGRSQGGHARGGGAADAVRGGSKSTAVAAVRGGQGIRGSALRNGASRGRVAPVAFFAVGRPSYKNT